MVSARRRLGAGLLAATMTLAAGCGNLADPAAAHGLARNDLVAELATQLAASASQAYVATYQLAGGATGTIAQAQAPLRRAYRYPGGAVLLTPGATTRCTRRTCTVTAPARVPRVSVFADALAAGLITPAGLENLLNGARTEPDLAVSQHDTTIASRHATCVELGNVDAAEAARAFPSPAAGRAPGPVASGGSGERFRACVTSDGLIGSFAGTVNGVTIDMALTDYADRAADTAFEPPATAAVVDRR